MDFMSATTGFGEKVIHWITGITSVDQALLASRTGADAIVCHQHPMSLRFCSIQKTSEIVRISTKPVWIQFENDHPMVVRKIISDTEPTGLIFNGTESPEFCEQFGLPYVRRMAIRNGFAPSMLSTFENARYLILDAYAAPQFGEYSKSPYLWEKLMGLDLERVLLAGHIPLNDFKNLRSTLGLAGFEWGVELEERPWVFDPNKLDAFASLIR